MAKAKANKQVEPSLDERLVEFGGETISTVRLRQLHELRDMFHQQYLDIGKYNRRERDAVMENIIAVYIPNVLLDFPALLGRIASLERYVERVETDRKQLKDQAVKAYRYAGYTWNDFCDTMCHLPSNPKDLED